MSVLQELSKDGQGRDLVKFLQRILAAKDAGFNSVIQGAAARLISALLSEFYSAPSSVEDARIMLNFLITNSLKSNKSLSDYIISVCLSHLLLVPGVAAAFLSLDGMMVLREILERNAKDLQVTYYTFLCLWVLSFEESFKRYAADPKVTLSEPFDSKHCGRAQKNCPREANAYWSKNLPQSLSIRRVRGPHD